MFVYRNIFTNKYLKIYNYDTSDSYRIIIPDVDFKNSTVFSGGEYILGRNNTTYKRVNYEQEIRKHKLLKIKKYDNSAI